MRFLAVVVATAVGSSGSSSCWSNGTAAVEPRVCTCVYKCCAHAGLCTSGRMGCYTCASFIKSARIMWKMYLNLSGSLFTTMSTFANSAFLVSNSIWHSPPHLLPHNDASILGPEGKPSQVHLYPPPGTLADAQNNYEQITDNSNTVAGTAPTNACKHP